MARGEHGEYIGLTAGDVSGEISDAINTLLTRKPLKRLDGEGWTVYRVGDNMVRADLNISKLQDRAEREHG